MKMRSLSMFLLSFSVSSSFHCTCLSIPWLKLLPQFFVAVEIIMSDIFPWLLSHSLLLVKRKYNDFFILIFGYWYLTVFIDYVSILSESLMYRITSFAKMDILTFSFPFCIPFIYSILFIAISKTSNILLNRKWNTGYPCLVTILVKMLGICLHWGWCWHRAYWILNLIFWTLYPYSL